MSHRAYSQLHNIIGAPCGVDTFSDFCSTEWADKLCSDLKKKVHTMAKKPGMYGVQLKDIGEGQYFNDAQTLLKKLFSEYSKTYSHADRMFTLRSAFVMKYEKGEYHKPHSDDTDITVNLSLNNDYQGGELYFRDCTKCTRYSVSHKKCQAIVHAGLIEHGALPLSKGSRINLVMWCSCPHMFSVWSQIPTSLQETILSWLPVDTLCLSSIVSKKMRTLSTSLKIWQPKLKVHFGKHNNSNTPTVFRTQGFIKNDEHMNKLPKNQPTWKSWFIQCLADWAECQELLREQASMMCVKKICYPEDMRIDDIVREPLPSILFPGNLDDSLPKMTDGNKENNVKKTSCPISSLLANECRKALFIGRVKDVPRIFHDRYRAHLGYISKSGKNTPVATVDKKIVRTSKAVYCVWDSHRYSRKLYWVQCKLEGNGSQRWVIDCDKSSQIYESEYAYVTDSYDLVIPSRYRNPREIYDPKGDLFFEYLVEKRLKRERVKKTVGPPLILKKCIPKKPSGTPPPPNAPQHYFAKKKASTSDTPPKKPKIDVAKHTPDSKDGDADSAKKCVIS